jgi:hypothetical protein
MSTDGSSSLAQARSSCGRPTPASTERTLSISMSSTCSRSAFSRRRPGTATWSTSPKASATTPPADDSLAPSAARAPSAASRTSSTTSTQIWSQPGRPSATSVPSVGRSNGCSAKNLSRTKPPTHTSRNIPSRHCPNVDRSLPDVTGFPGYPCADPRVIPPRQGTPEVGRPGRWRWYSLGCLRVTGPLG